MFVNTSLYEGFPNTFIQAWSHGAVVASLTVDIDGGMEAQGVGYCAGSFDRLEKIIDRLVSSPEAGDKATARRGLITCSLVTPSRMHRRWRISS